MPELWRKLKGRLRRDAIEEELREEMQTHLEMKASDSGDVFASRRQFGNATLLLEDSRDAWSWPRFENWTRDFRYALRVIARKPGFASTIVLTLALGIGSTSTIFSLIDIVLIRPLPYPDSERLVVVSESRTPIRASRPASRRDGSKTGTASLHPSRASLPAISIP